MREDTWASWDHAMAHAQHYIEQHYGDSELMLDTVALEVGVSRFHFHRMFKIILGETPGECLRRLRLEAALLHLVDRPDRSLTRIAYDCGFSSQSLFSRMFRQRFGSSPVQVRRTGRLSILNPLAAPSAPAVELPVRFPIHVREIEPQRIACVLTHGYDGPSIGLAYARLFPRALRAGLIQPGPMLPTIGIAWDNPEITRSRLCRYYAGVVVPKECTLPRGLVEMNMPGGSCVCLQYTGTGAGLPAAYGYLYGDWMINSGRIPADFPAWSVHYEAPFHDGGTQYRSEIRVLLRTEQAK